MSRWTEERVEFAKRRWKEGGSGAEIAAELGEGFTKNSVICKMFRLGLSFQGGSRDGRGASDRVTRARTEKVASSRPRTPRVAKERVAKEARPQSRVARLFSDHSIAAPEMPAVTSVGSDAVHALEGAVCKWPVGDPLSKDFRFCCAPQQSGFPYCGFHARMAYVPASRRAAVAEVAPMPMRQSA